MNFVPVITHAFAILAGWLLVSFACIRMQQQPVVANAQRPQSHPAPFRVTAPRPTPSPRTLLAAQAAMPMDPRQRAELKDRIFRDWARSDPAGMLRHLENRPWLTGVLPPTEDALYTLSRTHPARLLDYARRNGCDSALFALSSNGDPRRILELFLDAPADTIPSRSFRTLFRSGCALEPDFHRRLDLITDPDARLAAVLGTTEMLLDQKRENAVFPWLAQHAGTLPPKPVAALVAKRLIRNQTDLNDLSRLPDVIRSEALPATLRQLADSQVPGLDAYRRSSLTTFLRNGWLDGKVDLASTVIAACSDHGAEWKQWALELPGHPKWDPLRQTAIHEWALANPDQWETFATLPSQDLRDTAFAATLQSMNLQHSADHIPWILAQITNPTLKSLAVETVTQRLRNAQADPLTITTESPGRR